MRGNGVGMGTACSERCWNGLGTGQEYILQGGNGVKHLSLCHSLVATATG